MNRVLTFTLQEWLQRAGVQGITVSCYPERITVSPGREIATQDVLNAILQQLWQADAAGGVEVSDVSKDKHDIP
jgi:hypothetical protein